MLGSGLALAGTRFAGAAPTPPMPMQFPRHTSRADPQFLYMRRLAELALTLAGYEPRITDVATEMTQQRSIAELALGRAPNEVMWTVTSREREEAGVLPVRVPIDRGLLGWRVLVVRRAELPHWRSVRSLTGLRKHAAGQGHDWPDTAVLRANDLPVVTSANFDALFRMLERGRFDYFPRSVLEVDGDLAQADRGDLAIVPDLLLHYPAATYFFVTPRRPDLARALEHGLELAVAAGSLQRLHLAHYGAAWRRHAHAASAVLELENPALPPLTPVGRREFWFSMSDA